MEGETDFGGLDYTDVQCVLDEVDMPSSVEYKMGQTTSLDGIEEASWDDIDASWTYHPDDGLDIFLEVGE
jgi:hypothetical protein